MSQPPLARPCYVPRAMPRVYSLSCHAPTQRPPARLAYRIVSLAAVSWALAARQPGRIVGSMPRACWPCPRLAVFYCNISQPFLICPVTIQSICIAIQVSSLALQPVAIHYTELQHSSPAALPTAPFTIQFHCIVRLLPGQPNCNTPSVLQYKILPSFPPIPQYTLLYCDTTSLHLVSPAFNTNFAF